MTSPARFMGCRTGTIRGPARGRRKTWGVLVLVLTMPIVVHSLRAQPTISSEMHVTDAERRAVLEKALADFEAAVAMKHHAGPQARQLYESSRDGFQSLIDSGVINGRLYYNLANAHLRLGDLGQAVVNYRRALRLMPGDVQTQKNLEFARKLCEVRFQKPAASAMMETLFFWHYGTSRAARLKFALAAYSAFWFLALAARFLPRRVPSVTWLTVTAALFCAAVGGSVAWESVHGDPTAGVLIADDVVVRKGNGAYYEPQFEQPLPQGVEFEVLESRPDVEGRAWYRVRFPDGKQGWLRADQAEII